MFRGEDLQVVAAGEAGSVNYGTFAHTVHEVGVMHRSGQIAWRMPSSGSVGWTAECRLFRLWPLPMAGPSLPHQLLAGVRV